MSATLTAVKDSRQQHAVEVLEEVLYLLVSGTFPAWKKELMYFSCVQAKGVKESNLCSCLCGQQRTKAVNTCHLVSKPCQLPSSIAEIQRYKEDYSNTFPLHLH